MDDDQIEKRRAQCRRYYAENKQAILQRKKEWREAHPEEYVTYYKGYYQSNKNQLIEKAIDNRKKRVKKDD